ncbi:MAG: YifB family Mg chelatase-like AAA ATPase [Lachnospiraceae bacterium]|nr:YifB family Mg chelatase-like AAA ATPase [Lachnospiraceae bacterium]
MYSKVSTAIIRGVDSVLVSVETDISQGLPCVEMVGLLASEVKESKNRVRAALHNSGFTLPIKRITINISPASIHKYGSGFDLPIALSILSAMEMVPMEQLENIAVIGELSLDGKVLPVNGVLSMALSIKEQGIKVFLVPKDNQKEASLVPDLCVVPVSSIKDVMDFLNDGVVMDGEEIKKEDKSITEKIPDFSEINGQRLIRRACEVAVSGMHNFLMIGPPGAGKTMIAKCIPSILPPMTEGEKVEVSKVYSVAGLLKQENGLIERRPFRSPHHTISAAGLVGGGAIPHPGEISLAHRGVLFLDELPEFQRSTLEVLRQPMEDGCVNIARSTGNFHFPSDFILVAAMNPCNCGYYPDMSRCRCSIPSIQRYLGKISQPLLDRMDIAVQVSEVPFSDLESTHKNESSEAIRQRVVRTQKLQQERFCETNILFNSQMRGEEMERYCALSEKDKYFMEKMYDKMNLTARTYHKVLKVARTIADMEESDLIEQRHLMEALMYRSVDKGYWEALQ